MPTTETGRQLAPLFEAELRYSSHSPDDAVVTADDRYGQYIGSGTGIIRGERIRGRIRWSFYAADCSYLLVLDGRKCPPAGTCVGPILADSSRPRMAPGSPTMRWATDCVGSIRLAPICGD